MNGRAPIVLALIALACAACERSTDEAAPDAAVRDASLDAPRARDSATDAPSAPPIDSGTFPAASYAMRSRLTWLIGDVRGLPSQLDFTMRLDRRGTTGEVRAVIGRSGTADSVRLRQTSASTLALTASTARVGVTGPCATGTLRITVLEVRLLDEDGDPTFAERVEGVLEATYAQGDTSGGEALLLARGTVQGTLDDVAPTVAIDPFVPFTDVLVRASEPLVPAASATVSVDGLPAVALARLGSSSVGGFVLPRALLRHGAEHVVSIRSLTDLAGLETTPEPLVLRVPPAPPLFDDTSLERLRTGPMGELVGLDALAQGDVRVVDRPLAREGEHALRLEATAGDEDDPTTAVWLRWRGDPATLHIDAYARTADGGEARPLLVRAFAEDDGALLAHVTMFFDLPAVDGLDPDLPRSTSLQQQPLWRVDGGPSVDETMWIEIRPLGEALCGTTLFSGAGVRTAIIVERIGPPT